MDSSIHRLRLTLVLSGGASLGAFEAGALAAVLVAVQHLQQEGRGPVVVDGVGGASAGALVALFGAHALLEGFDPADFLHQAWVERVSLDLLRRRPGQGLLALDRLREDIGEFLGSDGYDERVAEGQDAPVGLHVAITCLQGLTYRVRSLDGAERFTATTYSDWGRFVLEPGGGARQLFEPRGTSPLDFVLASAAHPGAFTPALLDRREHVELYRRHGIGNFPESGHIWYTDGGLMQNQPLGYVLAAARAAEESGGPGHEGSRRAAIVIDPRSEDPSGASAWTDPERTPRWLDGLRRGLEIVPAQAVYDDAVRIEKTNSRLRWLEDLVDRLAPRLDDEAVEVLRAFIQGVDRDRSELPREDETSDGTANSAGEPERRKLLHGAVARVAGLHGKEPVDVSVISPLQLAEDGDADVRTLLAGEFMADFGGFLDRDVRRSDFLLGYGSAQAWLDDWLPAVGLDEGACAAAGAEVARRSPGDWRAANEGRVRAVDLPWTARLALARLAWDALRAVGASAFGSVRVRDGVRRGAARVVGAARDVRMRYP
jgi:hypothetical protein